jgi:2-succinyl-5-enolpyruvyl-6-hydroxy-3-cyclohexene-1-carboxylate synthase
LSQLKGHAELRRLTIRGGEKLLQQACTRGELDSILRIGGVPTLRLWRDLEDKLSHLDVLSISSRPFAGLARGQLLFLPQGEGKLASHVPVKRNHEYPNLLLLRDSVRLQQLERLLLEYPQAEPSLVKALAEKLSQGSFLYLGNSMPIRQWDLVSIETTHLAEIAGNRGANGIDGQISSFLGMAQAGRHNVAIIGDLTALYDLSSLWALRHLTTIPITIVIINNGGGRIFERVFGHEKFRNPHQISFDGWARQWQLDYEQWDSISDSDQLRNGKLIEIRPHDDQTQAFWQAFSKIGES